jgi:hypothetical protein
MRSYRKIYQRASSGRIPAIDHNRAPLMTMQATVVLRPQLLVNGDAVTTRIAMQGVN